VIEYEELFSFWNILGAQSKMKLNLETEILERIAAPRLLYLWTGKNRMLHSVEWFGAFDQETIFITNCYCSIYNRTVVNKYAIKIFADTCYPNIERGKPPTPSRNLLVHLYQIVR